MFNTVKKEKFPRKSEGFEFLYGAVAAEWLKETCGITDFNGFNPKVVQADSTDVYMAKELKVSLKGFSSLPSLKDVRDKMIKGKVPPSAAIMVPYVKELDDFLASDVYKKAANPDKLFETWLEDKQKAAQREARLLIFHLAQIKFGIIVGQVWPVEFASLDENSLEIDTVSGKLPCTVEMREVATKI